MSSTPAKPAAVECDRNHCDDLDCPPCWECSQRDPAIDNALAEAVTRWHEGEHDGALRFCAHPVCVAGGHLMAVRHD